MASEGDIRIYDVRVSSVWAETFLDLLRDPAPSGAPMAFLGRRSAFARRFEQAAQKRPGPRGLEPPWPKSGKHYFWTFYLRRRASDDISGNKAWNALAPFRGALPAKLTTPGDQWRLAAEAFHYPHGLGIIVTATFRGALTLAQMVEQAIQFKRGAHVEVKWGAGDETEMLTLGAFADKGLALLRRAVLGSNAPLDASNSAQPFTVVTVIRADGVDPNEQTPTGGAVHGALEAMTTWSLDWQSKRLPDLGKTSVKLPIREESPPASVLYARTRGRAIWFPGLFTLEPGTRQHSLACYHRNLVLTSLQVESLAGLVTHTAEQIGTPLAEAHSDCVRHGAIILGRMYSGSASTYRSWSARAQIEQNNWLADLNKVRDWFDMEPVE